MLQENSASQKVGWELGSLEIVAMSFPRGSPALNTNPVSRDTWEIHLHQMSWNVQGLTAESYCPSEMQCKSLIHQISSSSHIFKEGNKEVT